MKHHEEQLSVIQEHDSITNHFCYFLLQLDGKRWNHVFQPLVSVSAEHSVMFVCKQETDL